MPNPSLLVVDDDPAVKETVQAGPRLDGCDLMFAGNGSEAITLGGEVFPHVIILDLKMPVMDGLEFLAEIKLEPLDPYSVEVLTAFADDKSVETWYRAGVSAAVKNLFTLN